eukprot:gene10250-biopygen9319
MGETESETNGGKGRKDTGGDITGGTGWEKRDGGHTTRDGWATRDGRNDTARVQPAGRNCDARLPVWELCGRGRCRRTPQSPGGAHCFIFFVASGSNVPRANPTLVVRSGPQRTRSGLANDTDGSRESSSLSTSISAALERHSQHAVGGDDAPR